MPHARITAEALVWVAGFLFLLFPATGWGFVWMQNHGLATPTCHWKSLVGLPCFGCGTGRAAIALVEGRPLEALAQQPLMLLLWSGCLLVLMVWLFNSVGIFHLKSMQLPAFRWWVRAGSVVLILNWCWLFWDGR